MNQDNNAHDFLPQPLDNEGLLCRPNFYLQNALDATNYLRYYKHKLVRFTGVPLICLVECGDFNKNKNSGLKQTNVPQWVGADQRKLARKGQFYLL